MASPILPGTGLGSGLDIGSIVTALVNADKSAKQTQIDSATKTNTLKISGIASLKSALSAFQATLTTLSSTTTPAFAGYAATSSASSVMTVTSDNTAVAGNYTVVVKNLATSSKVASASFAGGASSAIPSGTLKISQNGTDYNVTIPANATLQSTRDAINSAQGTNGISANIVTDSSGSSRLVISSNKTGAGSDLTVSGIAGLEIDGTQEMGANPSASSSGAVNGIAKNANLTVDGLAVSSKSNTVTGAISGITMNLVSADAGTPPGTSNVSVTTNTSGLQTSIQSFIDSYNTLMNTINSLSKATADADGNLTVAAAFTGDSMPRALISDIRSQLTAVGAGGPLAVLSQLGVLTVAGNDASNSGNLALDTAAFNKAMATNGMSGQVQQLFNGTNSSNGLLSRLSNTLNPYLGTPLSTGLRLGGMLDQRNTSYQSTAKSLLSQQSALDARVKSLTTTLTAKYNAMDLLVGQMKATANSITSFFSSLNAQKSS
ncbi:flagellar hook protein FliD [Pseudomonas gingeri NCPPB 3146 = LMG 5327]|uniref:Flagellar hook-associated protein 2 n=2 Tax=Pseudomonas gingeri TaxID=117681 RepID=A0A7Y7Y681_9PSED|nr:MULTISPECIES: flagellar filament capping protein FliD [Pseudomonas]NVZ30137.1 flagellar filament capping protein FliD [Pseudomonas gingeri]NWC18615.1 flagellar filament capping protein FliD [Pseudomonas gingeri]NWE49980.1 flagellar filament capping protein FliD [Pseudomonas gingeri]NWE71844.1 flagellar filament capping protein FliD [Pseudomonas gingeri]PNQ93076.1 flagellar hook protein FliD [Pseudomonas gingeri NCPPB 3146 = LMG 5327]